MFELSGTHFERGVFALDLEKEVPSYVRWATRLGPVRTRLVALVFILTSGFLNYFHQPARVMIVKGWLSHPEQAWRLQLAVQWTLLGIGFIFYIAAVAFRKESLQLSFDRGLGQFRFRHVPGGPRSVAQEGVFPFRIIQEIRVQGPERAPVSPFGHIEIRLVPDKGVEVPAAYRSFAFRVLSAEQFRFFPANIGKMTGRPVVGDWSDPDDEPVGLAKSPESH